MTDDLRALHHSDYGVEAHGPYSDPFYTFTVDGYNVPFIQSYLKGERTWFLTLDGRFAMDCEDDELHHWLPFLAHAMAVAGGYTAFGPGGQPRNPFASQLLEITPDTEGD